MQRRVSKGQMSLDIALSPIKKVSSYSLVSDEHIKIRLGQGSLYGFSFMLATGNGYHITILLLAICLKSSSLMAISLSSTSLF